MNRAWSVFIVLLVFTANLKAFDYLLTPIDIRLTIDPSDLGAVIHRGDPPLPKEAELKPQDAFPDSYRYELMPNGKAWMLTIAAGLLKPGTVIVKPDAKQFQTEFKDAGFNLNAAGVQKEITKFMGCDCYKAIADLAKTPGSTSPGGFAEVYIFYSHGRRYVVAAESLGSTPPDSTPGLKDILANFTFISDAKPTDQSSSTNQTTTASSSTSAPFTPVDYTGKPRSEPDLKSTIASLIIILQNADFRTLYENYLAASTTIIFSKDQDAAFAKMSEMPGSKNSPMLTAMESIKDSTPTYNEKNDQAVFKNATMPDGQTRDVRFNKINGLWYLDGF